MKKQSIGKGTCSVWAGEEEYLMQNATQVPVVHTVFPPGTGSTGGIGKGHIRRNQQAIYRIFISNQCRCNPLQYYGS